MMDQERGMVAFSYISKSAVMHPEFQRWGSVGPWFSKIGAHIAKYEFDEISQLPLI